MKNSFLLHKDALEVLDELTVEQVGELFLAIKDYQNGKEIKLTGLMKAVFIPFKNQFDRENENYDKISEVRKKAGEKGGIAKAEKSKQNETNDSKDNQILANDSKCYQNIANADDKDKDKDNDKELSKDSSRESKRKTCVFHRPTVEDVRNYCLEENYNLDAERFVDFYEAKGWVIGKSPVKDWKACVRNWVRRDTNTGTSVRPANSNKAKTKGDILQERYLETLGFMEA